MCLALKHLELYVISDFTKDYHNSETVLKRFIFPDRKT